MQVSEIFFGILNFATKRGLNVILMEPFTRMEGGYKKGKARVQFQNSKFQKKNLSHAWRLKFRRNKKRIATTVCKWRDESNELN